MAYRISYHASQACVARLGIDPLKTQGFINEALKRAVKVTYAEANRLIPIFHHEHDTNYYVYKDPEQNVVFVERDGCIVTLLTAEAAAHYGVPEARVQNGKCAVQTEGGDCLEDQGGWVRKMRQSRTHARARV